MPLHSVLDEARIDANRVHTKELLRIQLSKSNYRQSLLAKRIIKRRIIFRRIKFVSLLVLLILCLLLAFRNISWLPGIELKVFSKSDEIQTPQTKVQVDDHAKLPVTSQQIEQSTIALPSKLNEVPQSPSTDGNLKFDDHLNFDSAPAPQTLY
jgi:hypothetical protein